VRRYWDLRGQPQRQTIISRDNAYHGSTMAGASLGGMSYMHEQGGLPIPGIVHVEQPYWYQNGGNLSPEDYGIHAARAIERKILELGAENVAAFIGEPLQGAGGVIIPPDTYWPEVQRICREHGVLIIADEVVCGFGRTGRWFGQEHFGFQPDFMTLAKAITSGYLPLGAVMVADSVADVLINDGGEFAHGYTYSGHPAVCAAALANIAILRDEHLVDRCREDIGPYLQARWRELADHPLVGEARGIGMMFQDAVMFGHLSVGDNLAFGLTAALRGRAARRAAVEAALQTAGLAGFYNRDPATLSGGQRARAALMRTLLAEPQALLLDEPFSRLDAGLRAEIRSFVFDHARARALPVLLVTHDGEDAAAAAGPVVQL